MLCTLNVIGKDIVWCLDLTIVGDLGQQKFYNKRQGTSVSFIMGAQIGSEYSKIHTMLIFKLGACELRDGCHHLRNRTQPSADFSLMTGFHFRHTSSLA